MKVGMAVERHGVPVGVLADAANVGEADLGGRVLGQMPPEVEVPDEKLADRPIGNFEPSNSDTAPVDSDEPEKPDPKP